MKENHIIKPEVIIAQLLNRNPDEIKFNDLYNHEKMLETDSNEIMKNKLLNSQKANVKHYANLFNAVNNLVNMNNKSFSSYIDVIHDLKINKQNNTLGNIITVDNIDFTVKDLSDLMIKMKNYITSDNIKIPEFENIPQIFAYFGLLNVLQLNFGSKLRLNKKHKYTDYLDLSYYFIINILNNIQVSKPNNDIEIIKNSLQNNFNIFNYSCDCKQHNCKCIIQIRISTVMMYSYFAYFKILEKIFPNFKITLDTIPLDSIIPSPIPPTTPPTTLPITPPTSPPQLDWADDYVLDLRDGIYGLDI
jgi:hypothetical protein